MSLVTPAITGPIDCGIPFSQRAAESAACPPPMDDGKHTLPCPAPNTCHPSSRSRVRRLGDGFTLVEVLVTLVIVSIGLVAVLAALQKSVSAVDQARDVLRASALIAQRFAEIQAAAAERSEAPSAGFGRFAEPYGEFLWEQEVKEEVADTGGLGGKPAPRRWHEVQISVWREGRPIKRHSAGTIIGMPVEETPR